MKILYACIGLVIVAAAVWYALGRSEETVPETVDSPATSQEASSDLVSDEKQQFKGSLKELMARGGSWKCDVSATASGITTSGTTYIAMDMVRGDFTATVPQIGNVETHMIMREKTAYTWTSMSNKGFKFPYSEGEGQPEVSAEVGAAVNQDYDFSCSAWPTDESKFALPTGITF